MERTAQRERMERMERMERITDVAAYIIKTYKKFVGEPPSEMVLHKLLYFTQREYLDKWLKPLFPEKFEGWTIGPVSREVREAYRSNTIEENAKEIGESYKALINCIIRKYGKYNAFELSELTHKEISWKNSRKGLAFDEKGSTPLEINDIIADADKAHPYDREDYERWLREGEKYPYYNELQCRQLAKADKEFKEGKGIITTMAELEVMVN